MPKRRRHSDRRRVKRKRHLYLVMKDGEDGYLIRKFDLSTRISDDGHPVIEPLPPALVRSESTPAKFFLAIGTKIMVIHPDCPEDVVAPVYDVRKKRIGTGGPPPGSRPSRPIYVSVGHNVVALDDGSTELQRPPRKQEQGEEWRSWRKLPHPSFKPEHVTSHAVHPDGRTIFVSVESDSSTATFSLDTSSKKTKWRRHGKWKLPFTGRAHFVPVLDAWVGLSSDSADTLGYLCCCDVVPTDPADPGSRLSRASKLGKQRLFCSKSFEDHIGANLVYLGLGSNFCLLHYFNAEDDNVPVASASSSDLLSQV